MNRLIVLVIVLAFTIMAFGQDTTETDTVKVKTPKDPATASPHPADKGIGPVKSVTLGPINQEMAEKGKSLFQSRCSSCHAMNHKVVGPPLGDVANQRTPEFIMNMLLNTSEMENQDAIVKKLLNEYHIPMPDLSLTHDQARELLEYLRLEASKQSKK